MSKPRVLIVNCYSDNHPSRGGNRWFAPQTLVTAALAGQLHPQKLEIRTHCEFLQGTLLDRQTLAWPDVLVLTGLNTAFDRMKQLTACVRTLNPKARVIMGGPMARVLPRLSARYFDEVCTGDVEELPQRVGTVLGGDYAAEDPQHRYDLAPWAGPVGYAESSRNCNFRCSFCSMTAEDRPYTPYDTAQLERQILAQDRRACVMLLDQNFFGGPRAGFRARLETLARLHRQGRLPGWSALVTADFFKEPEHLRMAREAGCIGVFSGVESFSPEQVKAFNKKQNLLQPQTELIRQCLQAGLVFHYGLVFDLSERRIADIEAELDMIVRSPQITLPSFLSLAIPLLGTPLFQQRMREGRFLPHVRLRDMDGRSLVCHALDPLEAAVDFTARMDRGLMRRAAILRHAAGFSSRYLTRLRPWGWVSAMGNAWTMAYPRMGTNGRDGLPVGHPTGRSYLASNEPLGSLYQPPFPMSAALAENFQPLYVTDANGELHPDLQADLSSPQAVVHPLNRIDAAIPP